MVFQYFMLFVNVWDKRLHLEIQLYGAHLQSPTGLETAASRFHLQYLSVNKHSMVKRKYSAKHNYIMFTRQHPTPTFIYQTETIS